jgi:hypothetical protein
MRLTLPACIFVLLCFSQAKADIEVVMDAYPSIPEVVIAKTNTNDTNDCAHSDILLNHQSINRGYDLPVNGAGTNGPSVCWMRTKDLAHPQKGVLTPWTVCHADGVCTIN